MRDSREKWNDRYRQRVGPPAAPDPFLVDALPWLRPGRALDLACGDGRNSLYLAQHGFAVTGIDISPVGLHRLRSTAEDRGLIIRTLEADLEAPDLSANWGLFDNVLMVNYKPTAHLLALVHTLVIEGGIFLLCTFTQRAGDPFNPQYTLQPGAYREGLAYFECVHVAEHVHKGRHRDGYVFRRV